MQNLDQPFTFQFNVDASGTPEALSCKLKAATIAIVDGAPSADSITDSGNGFVVAGFQAGDLVAVSGSTADDATYEVPTVVVGTLTLATRHSVTGEVAATNTITLTAEKVIPEGISVIIKAKYANTGTICVGYSSATALNTGTGYFNLRKNESVALQVTKLSQIWLDATVSGEGVEIIFEKR